MSLLKADGMFLLVAMYVDDIVIAYNCAGMFWLFKDKLANYLNCNDSRELDKKLNIEIICTVDGGLLSPQASYVPDVLESFNEHVPANVNSGELHASPKIQLYAGRATKVKGCNADS